MSEVIALAAVVLDEARRLAKDGTHDVIPQGDFDVHVIRLESLYKCVCTLVSVARSDEQSLRELVTAHMRLRAFAEEMANTLDRAFAERPDVDWRSAIERAVRAFDAIPCGSCGKPGCLDACTCTCLGQTPNPCCSVHRPTN